MGIKALRIKLFLRLTAIFDVMFSEKFELTTWDKEGNRKSKTTFWRKEINEAYKKRK